MSQASAYNHYRRWTAFAARWDEALETGYLRLDMAMLEQAGRAFDMPDYPPDLPMPRMDYEQAIQLLRLHQARVHGVGKRPGARQPPYKSADEAFASLAHKLERMETMLRKREAGDAEAKPGAVKRSLERGARIVRWA